MRQVNVTVAIATRDRPDDLTRCLEAIIANDVFPAEIIVVDQSTDSATQAVVRSIMDKHLPLTIQYHNQQKRGLSSSRNAALESAHCPIIVFTDDDCVPDSDWIGAIDRAFSTPPLPDAVSGRVSALGPPSSNLHAISLRESTSRMDYCRKQIPWMVGTGGNFAVQRQWIERVGTFDERLGAGSPGKAAEDADLIYRLLHNGARIRYEPAMRIFHSQQSHENRLRSRWNYGYGIGGFCGLWLKRRDLYALYILLWWLVSLSRELIGLTLKRKWMDVQQRSLSIRGTLRGLVYGLTS